MPNPVIHVANHATLPVCIARDPNWDDQVLLIGGRPSRQTRCLDPGANASIGIRLGADTEPEENLMGVIFADAKDVAHGNVGAYHSTIGHDPQTGLLAVTDEHIAGAPSTRYEVANQTQWSMDMTFVDA